MRLTKNKAATLREAVAVLQNGGVIAFPTETTYGLGCDPRNAQAVKKIFQIKGRIETKPLQLIAASMAQVLALGNLNAYAARVAHAYWPGPLTLLIPLKDKVTLAKQVSPKRVIGIRVSSSAFVRKLSHAFNFSIAATSANRSGNLPAFSGRGVIRAFSGHPHQPDLILDIGAIPHHVPTTVALIHQDGKVDIVRQGRIRPRV